jgi:hypothetical protein
MNANLCHLALCLTASFFATFPRLTNATESPAQLCEHAANMAAAQMDIPGNILRAIALTETGRNIDGRLQPWPWVLNVGGEAVWFRSQAETLEHANGLIATGVTNFDIGCFQLNYRWHAANFDTLNSMVTPETNALYAARFLTQKYADLGSWGDAVGAYHSATIVHANAYLARFEEIYRSIGQPGNQPTVDSETQLTAQYVSTNRYPLLVPGKYGNGGSLVPSVSNARPLFGETE